MSVSRILKGTHSRGIGYRASIPSLFLRFVLILKVYILEKIIVLISKKCPIFDLRPYFVLFSTKLQF